MIARIVELSLVHRVMVCILGFLLFFGGLYAFHTLDIVAYPDPSPPMIELITQQPGWSAEEVERQITIPIEVAPMSAGSTLPDDRERSPNQNQNRS